VAEKVLYKLLRFFQESIGVAAFVNKVWVYRFP